MMRKILLTILIAVFAMPGMFAQSGLRPRGDVNCDWEVNIADINTLVDSILHGAKYHSFYSYATDLNGDKEISIADLNLLVDAVLGHELPPMPTFSGTLPVLYINTEGHRNIDSKKEYLHADWWLDNMGIEGIEPIGSPDAPLGMQIKGHGHYTWTDCDKKSFRLKFDEKHNILGMSANRHWVLKANAFSWKGQIEDALPFEIGRRMGMAWTPQMQPVEVVFNGQYIGLYFLYEKIRVGKHRVNITEQDDNDIEPENVTGGWLLEINNYREPNNLVFTEGNGKPFWVLPHSPEELSDIQYQYIVTLLMSANKAIYNPDKLSSQWEQYIDIDSLAVYYLVQEAVDNQEAFSGSCYMHKERGDSTKLIFGPLWDCDHSFYRYGGGYEFNQFIYEDVPSNWYSRWIGEIAKFPHFQLRVRYHWKRFYSKVYPEMDAFMDSWVARLEQAGNADYVRWPQYNGKNTTYRLNAYGKKAFHKKVAWLQSQWSYPDAVDPDPNPIDR